MSNPQNEIGLGLKMDAQTHFTDLTNFAASSRNAIDNLNQGAGSDLYANEAFAQSDHMDMSHGATYSTSSQDTLGKQAQADLNVFVDAPSENENHQPTYLQHSTQQHHPPSVPQPQKGGADFASARSSCLAQAFDMGSQPTNTHAAAQAHSAAHHYLDSPTRCSDSQTTVESPAPPEHGQGSAQFSYDCTQAAPVQPKMEHSPEAGHHQVRSHPPSPSSRSHMLPHADMRTFDNGVRSIGPRSIPSHRTSNSLGQASAFMSSIPNHRDMFPQYHASAPVSPSDGTIAGPFPQYFQNPATRQDMVMGLTERAQMFAEDAAHVATRNSGSFVASSAPSVRSASPSASLASTSMTSISPLGSARINPDGSFTSQESSFDGMSNAASGSFSRASSTSEDVSFHELGPLSLPSSLRMAKQKKKLRNIDRKMICDYSAAHPAIKQDAIANKFGIERSTVSKILKHKDKWLAIEPGSEAAKVAKHRAVKFPAVEDRLTSWAADKKARGEPIRDSTIRHEALRIARELGVGEDKFKASGGWIEKFRERNQIPKPQGTDTNNSAQSDADAAMRESTPLPNSGGVPLAPKPEFPSQASLAQGTAGDVAGASTPTQAVRRQTARNSKAMKTPQKRARDDHDATQAILGASPLSQDMARMHFNNGAPSGFIPGPGFFRTDLYHGGPPTMPQTMPIHYGHLIPAHESGVPGPPHPMEEEAELDRKRRRAMEEMQGNQAGMGLGPPIEFPFSPVAGQAESSSQMQMSEALSQAFGPAVSTPQKGAARSRRTPAKSTEGSGRGRSRRGKGRLSNANHTPQTPSPLSMSPADASGGAGVLRFEGADAEQFTAAMKALNHSGDGSSNVTPEQAKEALELLLRFLKDQSNDFLPPGYFVQLGHLQANIEQRIRDKLAAEQAAAQVDHAAEGSSSQPPPSALQNGEAEGDNVATPAEER